MAIRSLLTAFLTLALACAQANNDVVFDGLGKAQSEILKAHSYMSTNLDSAEFWVRKALEINGSELQTKGRAIAYTLLADILNKRQKLEAAFEYIQLAENANDSLQDPITQAYINYKKSLIFLGVGNYKHSGELAINSLTLFENKRDSVWMSKLYTLISGIYFGSGENQLSTDYLKKAIAVNEKIYGEELLAGDYHNLAMVYNAIDLESSKTYLRRALSINKRYGNTNWLAKNYHGFASFYSDLKLRDSAFYYFDIAEKTYNQLGNKQGLTSLLIEKTNFLIEIEELDAAAQIINSIREGVKGDAGTLAQVYLCLYKLELKRSNYKNSVEYLQQYNELNDSLQDFRNTSAVAILEKQREFEVRKSQLLLESERLKVKSSKQQMFIVLLIVFGVVLIVSIFLVMKSMRLKQQRLKLEKRELNSEIELKNRELTASTLVQIQQNEMLQSLIQKLEKSLKTKDGVAAKDIKAIINDLRLNRSASIWEEFELRFKNVHNQFYKNLRVRFPEITPAEMKICALLRLNMSTKEMSAMLFKSPQSLEVDRARIRKKLGLTNTNTNLVKFLMEV